jgi:arylsulfatase A-like enzyme
MVENIDRWIGVYLNKLRERGELENTLVVFSSDHGEMLGDHNLWGKQMPYQPSVSVPLIISGAGVQPLGSSDALASTMDLAATFLDYAGVPRPGDMDSLSLRPMLEGKTRTHRAFVSSGLGLWRMVFDGRYKFIRGFDPGRPRIWLHRGDSLRYSEPAAAPLLLFDLEKDPLENVNLLKDSLSSL